MTWLVVDRSDMAMAQLDWQFARAINDIGRHALVIFVWRVDVRCEQ